MSGSFDISFGKVSKFSSDKYDVIKIDVISKDLHKLNTLISDNTKCTDTHPEYKPHVTVSYIRNGSGDHLCGNDYFNKMVMKVHEVIFSPKSGSKETITLE